MKKTLKVICTVLYVLGAIFIATNAHLVCTRDSMIFIALSLFFFMVHLLAWIFPKTFFGLVWRISAIYSDSFDYETSYSKLDVLGLGLAIAADLFLVLGAVIAIF